MNNTNILDKLIDDLILEITGKDVVPLIGLLKGKTDVSEFKLAAKLNITVNQVRNMLYKLNNYNLVDFTRQKDKVKGWYIYFWTLNMRQAKDLSLTYKKNKISVLRRRLEKESTDTYFVCPSECVRFDSTNAMEYQFKCPECGKILVKEENKKNVERINKEILVIENELKELREFEEKQQKALERKLEKERELEKEKKLRKKKREERKKQKEKEAKKKIKKIISSKKPIKKKPKK